MAARAGDGRGTAVAGAAGAVEPGGPPYAQTDPFSEAVRLADGTCVGWADSRGGSTAGLAVGSPVAVLDPTTSALLGSGTITASRWEDPSGGGNQWTCFFDFSADVAERAGRGADQGRRAAAVDGAARSRPTRPARWRR